MMRWIQQQSNKQRQAGMVSLFVVMFSTVLITVVTVSFIRLMVQEQQRASNNDLSQSAYNSAVAGVEDGKRVIRAALKGNERARRAIEQQRCNTVAAAGVVSSSVSGETTIKTSSGSSTLNQAYTCVKIEAKTEDVKLDLAEGESTVIPLVGADAFDSVQIEWMRKKNSDNEVASIETPTSGDLRSLPRKDQWSPNAPALIRAQAVLPTKTSVSLSELDSAQVSTNFLRPSIITDNANLLTIQRPGLRANSDSGAQTTVNAVPCSNARYTGGGYACQAVLQMAGGESVPAGSRVAFLRVTSLYKASAVKISLKRASSVTKFDTVQPEIDSTGRADTIFRRIKSRVNVGFNTNGSFTFPEQGVDITGSLCKNFYVTNDEAGPLGTSCNP
jgi:hypothetical protein